MSHKRLLLAALHLAFLALVSVAVAAPVSNDQPITASGNLIRTSLQPDLTLKSTLAPALLPTAAFHQKTCRCSCGFPCNQNDDCGPGGICEQFISCCDKGSSSQWLERSALSSNRAGEAQPVNIKCK